MKISNLEVLPNGWRRFNLNVGGFCIRGCRWRPATRRIFFPRRYDKRGRKHKVVFAHGTLVNRLRALLEAGQTETPRDRRPCAFKFHRIRRSSENWEWATFDFTVRGFTILGCRWHPERGSIQLPVTFFLDEANVRHVKKRVVCAYGSHIVRLRKALKDKLFQQAEEPAFEAELIGGAV